jgi:hypothetical protein
MLNGVTWHVSNTKTGPDDTLTQPDILPLSMPATGPAGDWLCAWCMNHVAQETDRFLFEGQSEFTFSNPEGILFDIITFQQTRGCIQSGIPTLNFTWFEGYAWSFCHCERCGYHLGWYYAGPRQFAGLMKDRIRRALFIRN